MSRPIYFVGRIKTNLRFNSHDIFQRLNVCQWLNNLSEQFSCFLFISFSLLCGFLFMVFQVKFQLNRQTNKLIRWQRDFRISLLLDIRKWSSDREMMHRNILPFGRATLKMSHYRRQMSSLCKWHISVALTHREWCVIFKWETGVTCLLIMFGMVFFRYIKFSPIWTIFMTGAIRCGGFLFSFLFFGC